MLETTLKEESTNGEETKAEIEQTPIIEGSQKKRDPVVDPSVFSAGPRRPVDEFFDLDSISAVRTEDVYGDGSV